MLRKICRPSWKVLPKTIALIKQRDYYAVLEQLASLRDPVDRFFEDVMVMTENLEVRANRLAMLDKLHALFMHVADISKLASTK